MVIHVAVAVIINSDDQVLIAKRSADQHQGNKWEFPGGKVEAEETAQEALRREIEEELGVQIQSAEHITDIIHTYPSDSGQDKEDKTVLLDVFIVKDWLGEVVGKENQPILWVNKKELSEYDFPEANVEILNIINEL